ncbi:uncharacterized protein PHALS_02872 [Plasmopara halstedii]|uniref:Uncharacterized protein n=1 Tax=Plasmopara halstedii TaxID=4781 RepID=A0A0P1AYX4_PLAHL|nr:uncharacterized protein PHALS_02872 [Plasmopara halstedii]CEG46472.1 hypothetical protein PHALS_02872 [Plasmopara halstedii]|eukprot:XP_024582841.1 hypothetical protein PHALS_02872 [Plasmopara halstedii]
MAFHSGIFFAVLQHKTTNIFAQWDTDNYELSATGFRLPNYTCIMVVFLGDALIDGHFECSG